MTPEQRYFFDLTGYLHIPDALTSDELSAAQDAAERYLRTTDDELPPGFRVDRERNHFIWHFFGIAFDKALERLTRHPSFWPIVLELMHDRPRLTSGNLMINNHTHEFHPLHSQREGTGTRGPEAPYYLIGKDRVLCDHLVIFVYLTDVHPGDGGLLVVPGSHKSQFDRPEEYFYPGSRSPDGGYSPDYRSFDVPAGVANITPKAGDVAMISEMVTHGALSWKPQDRDRRFLTLRYMPQYTIGTEWPDEIIERLDPETRELLEVRPYKDIKSIVSNGQPA